MTWRRGAPAPPVVAPVRPGAEPYAAGDGPVGVLLCHGFSGSPAALRPWAESLVAAGYRLRVPRLPGHGTAWPELNLTGWTDWYAAVDRAYGELAQECDLVFAGGLSMGGALALRLAEQHGPGIAGLVLVNPVISIADPRIRLLPVLQRLVASLDGITNDIAKPGVDECGYDRLPLRALASQTHLWAAVRRDLARVRQPLLVYHSVQDHVADPSSLRLLRAGVGSTDLTLVSLPRSYHVATLDFEADDIVAGSVDFFERRTKDGDGRGI